jgi:hypothetical protein
MPAMAKLSPEQVSAVQAEIDHQADRLQRITGFVSARPGFRLVGARLVREPAVVVYVRQKQPLILLRDEGVAPAHLGAFPIDVREISPQIEWQEQADRPAAALAANYTGIAGSPIDHEFQINGSVLCHVGPDSGWVVLRDFIDQTAESFDAAIYDFNAEYIAQAIISAASQNQIPVTINIDDGLSEVEQAVQDSMAIELADQYQATIIPCNGSAAFPTAYHEKVIVRDDRWIWISSGNWTKNSQPEIDPVNDPTTATGMYKFNREYHAIFEQAQLAAVFKRYMQHDRDHVPSQLAVEARGPGMPDLFVSLDQLAQDTFTAALAVPNPIAPAELPVSGEPVRVRPVLSPDNYARRIKELIESATNSLYLQYSYITWSGKDQDTDFRAVLDYLGERSWAEDFDLRVIVGHEPAATAVLAEQGWNEACIRRQRPIHNKTIIADGKKALVSSQNWSGDGFLRNRDAGIIFYDEEIAQYYQRVFRFDWDNRARDALEPTATPRVALAGQATPAGMVRMRWEDYYGD